MTRAQAATSTSWAERKAATLAVASSAASEPGKRMLDFGSEPHKAVPDGEDHHRQSSRSMTVGYQEKRPSEKGVGRYLFSSDFAQSIASLALRAWW
jgi:hypothetical protein